MPCLVVPEKGQVPRVVAHKGAVGPADEGAQLRGEVRQGHHLSAESTESCPPKTQASWKGERRAHRRTQTAERKTGILENNKKKLRSCAQTLSG